MNENFDPYTFTSSVEFTGIEVVDDLIATAIFFCILFGAASCITSWQDMNRGKFLLNLFFFVALPAFAYFLFG